MANPDIYGRDVTVGEPFSADDSELLFNGAGTQTLVIQSMDIQYQQTITRLWEIGSDKQYFVAGHTQGTLNIQRVVGPKPLADQFFDQFGDVCNIQENHVTFRVIGDCSTNGGALSATGCVITNVSYRINAQDMVVNETVSMMIAKASKQ
jgi:hypothetical protein